LEPSQEGGAEETMSMDLKQEAAEQVRAHLVMVRGGAPFLSPIDAKLLVEWLDSAVPVDVILTAIEEAAGRRSKTRMKRPITLKGVKSGVKKGLKKSFSPTKVEALPRLIARLEKSGDELLQQASVQFSELSVANLGKTDLLPAVLEVARRFHEEVWEGADQGLLKAQAEEEIGDLREMLSEERYKTAVEEVARDNCRKRYKLLCATQLSQAFRK